MSTIIVGALVFGLVAAAILKIVRDHKSGCGCGCCDKSCGRSACNSEKRSTERIASG
jgi:hypothetical protein